MRKYYGYIGAAMFFIPLTMFFGFMGYHVTNNWSGVFIVYGSIAYIVLMSYLLAEATHGGRYK